MAAEAEDKMKDKKIVEEVYCGTRLCLTEKQKQELEAYRKLGRSKRAKVRKAGTKLFGFRSLNEAEWLALKYPEVPKIVRDAMLEEVKKR